MRKIGLCIVLLFCAGCCTVNNTAVERLEKNIKRQQTNHMRYVNADANLSSDDKDDWKKHYESTLRLVDSMKSEDEE
jgi:hypothetical protein